MKPVLVAALLLLVMQVAGAATVLDEDFNNLDGWNCYNDPRSGGYSDTPTKGHCTANGVAEVQEETNRMRYLAKDVTLPDSDSITLKARVKGHISAAWSNARLVVATSSGTTKVFNLENDYSSSSRTRGWTTVTQDLSSYAGETVTVRLEADGRWTYDRENTVSWMRADWIRITSAGSSSDSAFSEEFNDISGWNCHNQPRSGGYDDTPTKGFCRSESGYAFVQEETNRRRFLDRDVTLPDADELTLETRIRARVSDQWSNAGLKVDGTTVFKLDHDWEDGTETKGWTTVEQDISSLAGQTVQLRIWADGRWVYESQNTVSWAKVDYIRITAKTTDSDGDGVNDGNDPWPNDPDRKQDSDGDGVADSNDPWPNDSSRSADSDGDGVADSNDAFPNDPDRQYDQDGDGVADTNDNCVNSAGPFGGCPDVDPPGVTVSGGPASGWSNQPVQAGVTCNDVGPAGCRGTSYRLKIYQHGEQPETCPTDYSTYTERPPVTINSHVWLCGASRDRAGNVGVGGASPAPKEFRVDTTAPAVDIHAVSPTSNVSEHVTYTVDEENLKDCTAVGGDVSWTCSEASNGDGTHDGYCSPGSTMSDGSRTVAVTCEDDAGNTGSNSTPVTVDTTPPSITCDDCDSPDPIKNGNRVTFDPDVTDATTAVASITVCRDSACQDTFCSGASCTYRTPDNTYEIRDYWIRAVDTVGNTRVQGPPTEAYNVTVKKWVGQSCQTSDACLVGDCVDNTCSFEGIDAPDISIQ